MTVIDCFFDGYGSYESNVVSFKKKLATDFFLETVTDPSYKKNCQLDHSFFFS